MSLYNDDELEAPEWVNEEFLEKVLKNADKVENLKVKNYEVTPASIKGDHYASIMLRCKVKYQLGNSDSSLYKSLIIKTLPSEEGIKRDLLMDSNLFETEIQMFSEALPRIEKILAENGEPTKLAAEIYYSSLDPHKVIVFEDLCEAGYDSVRGRYLTEDEVKGVYSKLAQLHAVTYMLGHSDQHQLVTKYQEGVFGASIPIIDEMLINGLRSFIDLLSTHDDFHVYLDKVKAMQDSVHQACKDLYKAYNLNNGQGDIFVLNHGDFHMKNLMFKFDDNNKMEDVVMVDYQMSCYAPSTIDTTYSHFMILSPELRMKRHELMQYYFSEFIRIFKKINCPGEMPTFSEFTQAGVKYRHFSIFLVSALLPVVSGILSKPLDELKEMDVTKLFDDPDMIADTYHMPEYIQDLRNYLPIMLKEGLLEK